MDQGIFNVRTDVNVCDCTRGCTDTERESELKMDPGRKIPCRTGESNLRRQRAGLMLFQLSYIPNQWWGKPDGRYNLTDEKEKHLGIVCFWPRVRGILGQREIDQE